jgi:hypothetical protein
MDKVLHIRRVALNILNKQSRTADKGLPSSLLVEQGANHHCYKMSYWASETWTDTLEGPKQREMDVQLPCSSVCFVLPFAI